MCRRSTPRSVIGGGSAGLDCTASIICWLRARPRLLRNTQRYRAQNAQPASRRFACDNYTTAQGARRELPITEGRIATMLETALQAAIDLIPAGRWAIG